MSLSGELGEKENRIKEDWDFAIALNKMAGLTPSEAFLEIIEMEKRGKIQREDVKKFLEQKYRVTMKD